MGKLFLVVRGWTWFGWITIWDFFLKFLYLSRQSNSFLYLYSLLISFLSIISLHRWLSRSSICWLKWQPRESKVELLRLSIPVKRRSRLHIFTIAFRTLCDSNLKLSFTSPKKTFLPHLYSTSPPESFHLPSSIFYRILCGDFLLSIFGILIEWCV